MSDTAATILVVEDDDQIRRFLRTALESENCRVFEAGSCGQGLIEAATRKPDLVILDLGLPDRDGIEFVRDLRSWSGLPILILSARGDETMKVAALDAGADDYLTKPFGMAELLARLRVLLRRRARAAQGDEPEVRFGTVRIDLARRQVWRNDEAVHLTPLEYRVLTVLLANAGKVVTQRHLLREIWGPSFGENGHYLRIYVGRLRQKLEDEAARPKHFITETGVGYRLEI
ncbi:MAG: two-component system response regulator KdpE [Betaproteobacteria bacterium]